MTTTTPPKVKTIEEILERFDEEFPDGVMEEYNKKTDTWENDITDEVKAFLRTAIIEVLESVSYEVDNRYLTIKWLWNKEKTDTDKLFMVHKQMEHIKQLLENISKLKESK